MPHARYIRKKITGMPVVALPAEVDLAVAEQLRAILLDVTGNGHLTVVVDMTRTLFCDSVGIHVLLRAHRRAVARGGELRLVVPATGVVPRLISLTWLDSFIPCYPNLAEAMARASDAAAECR
jgi:anti-sigma B factor antagonist